MERMQCDRNKNKRIKLHEYAWLLFSTFFWCDEKSDIIIYDGTFYYGIFVLRYNAKGCLTSNKCMSVSKILLFKFSNLKHFFLKNFVYGTNFWVTWLSSVSWLYTHFISPKYNAVVKWIKRIKQKRANFLLMLIIY